jgi:hypothetical protein
VKKDNIIHREKELYKQIKILRLLCGMMHCM